LAIIGSTSQTSIGIGGDFPVLILTDQFDLIWCEEAFDLAESPPSVAHSTFYRASVDPERVDSVFSQLWDIDAFMDPGLDTRWVSQQTRFASLYVHTGEYRIQGYSSWICSPPGRFHGQRFYGEIPEGKTFDDMMDLEPDPAANRRFHFVFEDTYHSLLDLVPNDPAEWELYPKLLSRLDLKRGRCSAEQLEAAAIRRAALEQEPE